MYGGTHHVFPSTRGSSGFLGVVHTVGICTLDDFHEQVLLKLISLHFDLRTPLARSSKVWKLQWSLFDSAIRFSKSVILICVKYDWLVPMGYYLLLCSTMSP